MTFLRKIFGGTKLTWLAVVLFAVVTGVLTGVIMIVPFLKESAFVYIGVSFEFWFIFAVFVVSNCKNPLEAGLKCFVFFLVSQPLIYLVQQPFTPGIDLLRTYYGRWFIWTLFTFPGGMIAHLIKRKDVLGTLVLSVAGGYLAFMGTKFALKCFVSGGISNLLYGLICIAAAIVFMLVFCPGKKLKPVYGAIILAALITSAALYNTASGLCSCPIDPPGEWTVEDSGEAGISAYITDGDTLNVSFTKRNTARTVTCVNAETGETLDVLVTVDDGIPTLSFSR